MGILHKTLPLLMLTAVPLFASNDNIVVKMDFESDDPAHVTEEFYTGKKSCKFAGTGKFAYRKFPLKLKKKCVNRIYHTRCRL